MEYYRRSYFALKSVSCCSVFSKQLVGFPERFADSPVTAS